MTQTTHLHLRHRGLVPTTQLGSGYASASNFLRGDGQWHSNYVQRISSSSSNYFIGDVNLRAGTGVAFAASSNDITISATGGGGGGPTSHTILSSTHTDTLAGSVARGSIIRGNGTPLWEALPIGGSAPSNAFLSSNGTDAFWEWPAPVHRITSSSSDSYWGQVDIRAGSGVALARSSNTLTISATGGGGGSGNYTGGPFGSGTSFPGSPANNDLFYRTDRDILYFYDSTATAWLTVTLYVHPFSILDGLQPLAADGVLVYATAISTKYQMYMVDWIPTTYVGGTNDASKYWTLTLNRVNAANTATSIATMTTQGDTPDNWVQEIVAINAAVDTSALNFRIGAAKTSTPGAIYGHITFTYRLVG